MATFEPTAGTIVHVELYSTVPADTRAFYEAVFGWQFEAYEPTEYLCWEPPDPPSGGIESDPDPPFDQPPTLLFVGVASLEAARQAITDAGGQLLATEIEVPEMGAIAVYEDPGGVVGAAWENHAVEPIPDDALPVYTDDPEPGSIVHFELYSDDPAATRDFHETVFDWDIEPIGEGGYTMIEPPTPPRGGLMSANETVPAGALTYILVEDATTACEAIADAGGTVVRDPYTVEGWGTMAVFEAPGGVLQAVWEHPAGT